MGPHYLDRMFAPRAIAVFGASERPEAVGARVFENLLQGGFSGHIYAINPKHTSVQNQPCYANVSDAPSGVDLAVIATPAKTVPDIIRECGEHGIRTAVVLSAGFGPEQAGVRPVEYERLENARRRYNVRVLGPNSLGLMRTHIGLNAAFSLSNAQKGSLALVSQSGAICTAILDWALSHRIGFSTVVSLGDANDVDFGDVLDYLALDGTTRAILLYIEGIKHARGFLSGLRAAARMKPVVVVKAGRHSEGLKAAMSHTGAMIGGDDVFDAALARAGAVRAMTIDQLFAAAQLLSTHHRVQGNRLAIVTNGGGPGVMAADRAADLGVQLAELAPDTLTKLDAALPSHWPRRNPVDIIGDAPPQRFRTAVAACLADSSVDGVLVMLSPQAMTDPLAAANAVIEARGNSEKPVLACWMGEARVEPAWKLFNLHELPSFPSPEASVEAFAYLANYRMHQQLLLQVPEPLGRHSDPDIEGARFIVDAALAEHRTKLSGLESRAILKAFQIPVSPAQNVHSPNEALIAAETLGFPVAMKINSPDISHKSDVSGVILNIGNAFAVRNAYHELINRVRTQRPEADIQGVTIEPMAEKPHGRELMVGVIRDAVFGPVICFGAGGTSVEILSDRAVALPPLNTYIAQMMIKKTRIARLLAGFRHLPAVNLRAVQQVLRSVSELVCEIPQIRELDINPLIADENGVLVVDARLTVDTHLQKPERYGHMSIHPYPGHLSSHWQLADGTDILIRPIRPEDAEIEQSFVRNLSDRAKHFRFMQSLRELTPEMLIRFTQIDYDRELAFIAVVQQEEKEVELAVARYTMNPDGRSCEFALVVADAWQKRGIGSRLMQCLMEAAKTRGFDSMAGEVLADNTPMLALVRSLGFTVDISPEDPGLRNVIKIL